MKRKFMFFLMISLLVGVFCPRLMAAAKSKSKTMYVKKNVAVRKKPSSKAKKTGEAYVLDRVTALETDKGWTKIKFQDNIHYMKRSYLTTKRPKYSLKSVPGNSFKSYESYRKLHYKQGELQRKAYTDKNGLRKVDNRYCIAMGSYYSTKIGCKIDLVMSDGQVIKCILADVKSDRHTDSLHRKHRIDGSVVEFVVDVRRLSRKVKQYGDVSKINYFKRSVRKVRVYK